MGQQETVYSFPRWYLPLANLIEHIWLGVEFFYVVPVLLFKK